jgi:2-polyprenyl-3-methyl-5-hydroxy-6-metoxy-1,4-benzoquinol methylase
MTEFDRYALEYEKMHADNVKPSGYDPAYFDEYKIKEIHARLHAEGVANSPLKILNFGCGIGKSEPFLRSYFPNAIITGIDVSVESVKLARKYNAHLHNVTFDTFEEGGDIPKDVTYDVILIANVFHHIPHKFHVGILQQLREIITKSGSLFIFEHNPHNPLTVRTINRCPFDVDAVLLYPAYTGKILRESGFTQIQRRFTLFFPKFLKFLLPLEQKLKSLPIGAQYYFQAKL